MQGGAAVRGDILCKADYCFNDMYMYVHISICSELRLFGPAASVQRVKVSVLVNELDMPARELEMFYYRPMMFYDFHPKAGNINGGTQIHVYGHVCRDLAHACV